MNKKLILASASPRRRDILTTAGYSYTVSVSNAAELTEAESATELVRLNALAKAREVFEREGISDCVVLGADTVVCLDEKILGKPNSREDAFNMLKSLSGRTHEVISGYAVIGKGREESGACITEVHFKSLSDAEINCYLDTNEPFDKAGSYAVQEKACLFVKGFTGDFFNIVGLPVSAVYEILLDFGISPDWQA